MRHAWGAMLGVLLSAQAAAAQTAVPEPAAAPAQPGVVEPAPARSTAGLSSAFLARVGYFTASDSGYKDIYGSGISYGGELRIALPPLGRALVLFAGGDVRAASGETTFTKDSTDVAAMTGEAGLLVRLSKSRVSPYLGAGASFVSYEEKSEALGTATGSAVGFVGVGGLAVALSRTFACDLQVKYNTVNIAPKNAGQPHVVVFDVDAGGLTASVGIGFRF